MLNTKSNTVFQQWPSNALVHDAREQDWRSRAGEESVGEILVLGRDGQSEETFPWRSYVATAGQREFALSKLAETMRRLNRGRKQHNGFARACLPINPSTIVDFASYKSLLAADPHSKRLSMTYDCCRDLMLADCFVFFTIDSRLVKSTWLESGRYLNKVVTLAAERGLMAQTNGFSPFQTSLKSILRWGDVETPVCGMGLFSVDSMRERIAAGD